MQQRSLQSADKDRKIQNVVEVKIRIAVVRTQIQQSTNHFAVKMKIFDIHINNVHYSNMKNKWNFVQTQRLITIHLMKPNLRMLISKISNIGAAESAQICTDVSLHLFLHFTIQYRVHQHNNLSVNYIDKHHHLITFECTYKIYNVTILYCSVVCMFYLFCVAHKLY